MKHSLAKMSCLDVYLSSLSSSEYEKIKHKITPLTERKMPLQSWDVYMEGYYKTLLTLRKENEFKEVNKFAKKFNWKNNANELIRTTNYDAIIITDAQQNIIWVNDGFSKMTGYSKSFALTKTPRFLQGKDTSEKTKLEIKQSLNAHKPFQSVIRNYKKNGVAYNCDVKIFPLYDYEKVTHYIALEREVS